MLADGTMLQGRYEVERLLGTGGMGAVYLVSHVTLGRRLAVKEMVVDIQDERERREAVAQFHREAELLFDVQHPGLTRVIDLFEQDGRHYLVMEYVDGRTLWEVDHEAGGSLPVAVVCDWVEQICDVLAFLHARNPPIIVRDLKPNNVMLDATGRIRLIDFGLARSLATGAQTNRYIKGAGSAGFSPHEQFDGSTDERSDIYSLGATFYTLLTRRVPPLSLLRLDGTPFDAPSVLNPHVPPVVDAVVLKMMAVEAEDRYQTMEEARKAVLDMRASVSMARTGLLNLERNCGRCDLEARPLASLCARCGTDIPGDPHGPEWGSTPSSGGQKTEARGGLAGAETRPGDKGARTQAAVGNGETAFKVTSEKLFGVSAPPRTVPPPSPSLRRWGWLVAALIALAIALLLRH